MSYEQFLEPLNVLADCALCPRNCHTNRFISSNGYCKSDSLFNISSICIHRGEEPAISGPNGICNIFFSQCNLKCIYCQNHQISSNCPENLHSMEIHEVIRQVIGILDQGIKIVGFVSPSHYIPHVKIIINIIESLGYKPVWVFNTNGFDKVETLQSLEGLIDVYLPDIKYLQQDIAAEYSDAHGYPEVVKMAIKEMYRQKGSTLILNDDGTAASGIIIRHLVLPGNIENSVEVLQFIANELSPKIHISLMSQYFPTESVINHPVLNRQLLGGEYNTVTDKMEQLGLYNGWIQELTSNSVYRPDFENDHPFE